MLFLRIRECRSGGSVSDVSLLSSSVVVVIVVVIIVVGVEYVSSVGEVGVSAGEDVGACSNHILGEGELLAVEDEEVSVVVEVFLAVSAISLQSLDSAFLIGDLVVVVRDSVVVVGDSVVVLRDVAVVVGDAAVEVIDVVVEVDKVFSEGFEGDHELGFLLESVLVRVLIPDLVPFIEVVDLMPEVAGWDVSGVVMVIVFFVVVVVVDWLWVFVVVVIVVVVDIVVHVLVGLLGVVALFLLVVFVDVLVVVIMRIVVVFVMVVVAVVVVGSVFDGVAVFPVVVVVGASGARLFSRVLWSEVGHVASVVEGSVVAHEASEVVSGLNGRGDGGEDSSLEVLHYDLYL